MITERQKRAANIIIRQKKTTGVVNQQAALLEAGYSPSQARASTQVMNSKGFREVFDKYNLNEDTFAGYLSEDLQNKPGSRLGELQLLAKVLGLDKSVVDMNVNQVDESIALIRKLISGSNED